jgi:hypothetical protein
MRMQKLAQAYGVLGVGGAAANDVHIAEVARFGVVLEVRRPHDRHPGAQVQLLAQVCPPLQTHHLPLNSRRKQRDQQGAPTAAARSFDLVELGTPTQAGCDLKC